MRLRLLNGLFLGLRIEVERIQVLNDLGFADVKVLRPPVRVSVVVSDLRGLKSFLRPDVFNPCTGHLANELLRHLVSEARFSILRRKFKDLGRIWKIKLLLAIQEFILGDDFVKALLKERS